MAKFTQLFIGATLILAFVSLSNVSSTPVNAPASTVEETKKHGCLSDIECGHGKCSNQTADCVCDPGYAIEINTAGKIGLCSYIQRSKLSAFLISLFAGEFGADWFYLSRANYAYIIAGVCKLLLTLIGLSAWPLTYFGPEALSSETTKTKILRINKLFTLLAFSWWIVDWARVLGNRFPDGNGASLMSW